MFPRRGEALRPVIFLNYRIPDILPLILKEYKRLQTEAVRSVRLYGPAEASRSAPLVSWYGEILGNVLSPRSGTSGGRCNAVDQAFALPCVLFTPEEESEYCYAGLDLPPLWKGFSAASSDLTRLCTNTGTETGRAHSGMMLPGHGINRDEYGSRLIFSRTDGYGAWYASIPGKVHMRRILSQYIGE